MAVKFSIRTATKSRSAQTTFFLIWFVLFMATVLSAVVSQSPLAIDIALVLLMVLGAVMAVDSLRELYFSAFSHSWPRAGFKVARGEVIRCRGHNSGGVYYTIYTLLVYHISGQRYELDYHAFNLSVFSTKDKAQAHLGRVVSGELGQYVYYQPGNPARAYVEPGMKLRFLPAAVVGLAIVALALLTLLDIIIWSAH